IVFCLIMMAFMFGSSCGLFGGEDEDQPTIPGKIVFAAKDDNQNSQIYTMNATGFNLKQLTDFPGSGVAYAPSWSPDGKQIIFTSFKGGISTGPAIWVMDADGSNQRFLYHPEPDNEHAVPIIGNNPRWSPDGTKVAFDLCLNCQVYTDYTIWVFDTLTKNLTQLTPHEENPGHPASDLYPTWSPDGTQIAFTSNRDYVTGDTLRFRTELYIMDEDGKNQTRITDDESVGGHTWMDSEHIIYTINNRNTNLKDVLLLDVETRQVILLMESLRIKNQFWVFWDFVNVQLLSINKNHQELPVIISTYDQHGEIQKQFQLKATALQYGLDFDWFVEEN
ncbi:MAG: DPP IV N-terminal domain-containing protein, partial [Balneolaceae bacterium]